MSAQNPGSLPAGIDASPEPAPVDPAPPNGPQAANLGDGANGRLSDPAARALDGARLAMRSVLREHTCWHDPRLIETLTDAVANHLLTIEREQEHIVREHAERALAEVEQRIKDKLGVTSRALPIVRAARQEQDR